MYDGRFYPLEAVSTAAKGLDALARRADISVHAVGFPLIVVGALGLAAAASLFT
jgi:hypothetical protein